MTALVTAGVLVVLGGHLLTARHGPAWTGVVAPLLWVATCTVTAVQGLVPPARALLACLSVLAMLLWVWSKGRQGRLKQAPGE